MKVLVACEESQAVTIELRKLGHEAFSCDIIECSGGHPEWHIQGDALKLINGNCTFQTMDGQTHTIEGKWDMIIAFPPCTHLAVSGARHFEKKRADGRQREGIEFFCQFLNADCDRIAIENPVGIISGDYIPKHFPDLAEKYGLPRKPTQIIQPYEYGDHARKTTCLWIKGLPCLIPTNICDDNILGTSETHFRAVIEMLRRQKQRAVFSGGLEPAFMQPWQAELLKSINPKTMYTAYDTKDDYEPIRQMASMLWDAGFTPKGHQIKCYCLCGYDGDSFDAAEQRMNQIMDVGFLPFAMLYRDDTGATKKEWRQFQREWANSYIVGKKFSERRNDVK